MAALTDAQLATLAADIRANPDPDVVAALAARNDTELARLYNLDSATWIWRTRVEPAEYRQDIVWTESVNLGVGEARNWEWITEMFTAPIDASDPNIRQGIQDVFSGPQQATTRNNLIARGKRIASVAEALFVTGAGAGTNGDPDVLGWEGPLSVDDVSRALNEF